jgi:hypothetical protein
MGYNKKMQMGGDDGPTRVRYGSRKTARKARRAVRRGETPPDPNAMPTPKPKGVVRLNKALRSPFKGGVKKSSTNPNFIEPNKELKFGGPGKYQTAGPKRERARIDEDVYTGPRANATGTGSTGVSPRERAQNTPQGTGAGRTGKSGSNAKTGNSGGLKMDPATGRPAGTGRPAQSGKSTTQQTLDGLGNRGGGGKSTQGGKATKIETGVKPRSETTKTEAKTEAKKTSGTSSFGKAFAAARKDGKFTFKWNGKSYGTRRSEETIEQHRAAMKKAGGDTPTKTPTKTEAKKTETKSTPSSTPKTKTKTESKTETTTPKAETKTETPTTPPDRRSMKSKAKETRKDLRGQIKEARKQKRTKKAVGRQSKRVGKLQEKLAKLKSMKTGGGMMK